MAATPHDSECALVTGGGGFLGTAIVRILAARGDRVRSFSRRPHPALTLLAVEQTHGDIADARAVEQACRGADVVYHTAAKPPPWGHCRPPHQRHGHRQRHQCLPQMRSGTPHPHQHAECRI